MSPPPPAIAGGYYSGKLNYGAPPPIPVFAYGFIGGGGNPMFAVAGFISKLGYEVPLVGGKL